MLQELIPGIYQMSQSTLRVRFNTIRNGIKNIRHYVFRRKGRNSSPAIRYAKHYPKSAVHMQKSGYQPQTVNIGIVHSSQNHCLASDAASTLNCQIFVRCESVGNYSICNDAQNVPKRRAAVPQLNKGKCSPYHHPTRSRRIARRNVSEGLSP